MKNTLTTGIVGYGTVGQATALLFEDVAIYDPPKGHTDLSALAGCPVSFVCVPTPTLTDGRCDLSFVYDAVSRVAPILSNKQILAIRSTVPPGTVRQLQEEFPNTHIASNPEFQRADHLEEGSLRPSRVVIGADTEICSLCSRSLSHHLQPSRVVIGADTTYSQQLLLEAYRSCLKDHVPYLVTDSVTAEFIKYAANCFLATKITYAQEIRKAASRIGAHYGDVVRAVGLDPRIGPGDEWFLDRLDDHCLPKDLEAFTSLLRSWRTDSRLLETVRDLKDEPLRGRPVAARKKAPPQASRQRK